MTFQGRVERPRLSCARRSRVDDTIIGLAVGHSGYAQPPASVPPALSETPSRVPHTRRALRAAQHSSPPRVGGLPRCRTARSWHEGRIAPTMAQTEATPPLANFDARQVHVSRRACRVSDGGPARPRAAKRSRRNNQLPRSRHRCHAQPPAPDATTPRASPSRTPPPFIRQPALCAGRHCR